MHKPNEKSIGVVIGMTLELPLLLLELPIWPPHVYGRFGMRERQKVSGGEKCVWVNRGPIEIEMRDINKREMY